MTVPEQTILRGPNLSYKLMRAWITRNGFAISEDAGDKIAAAYATYGRLTDIGSLMPFAQAIHETGAFSSELWLVHCNPAGLGATKPGIGYAFANIAEGVLAQFAHLLAYAQLDTELGVDKALLAYDPRLTFMDGMRGKAPRWIDLNGRWAVGNNYAQAITKIANQIVQGY